LAEERVSLVDAIARSVENVSTHALDISFNELVDMHENGELDIKPDYQRTFRWSFGQQSRFIESLLLEMPVPPIFVIETEAGHYELIDGLQRISTYLHMRGIISPHEETKDLFNPTGGLRLVECDIVPELNGKTFDDFPSALQIRLKRRFIRMEVIRKVPTRAFATTCSSVSTPVAIRSPSSRRATPRSACSMRASRTF
jgi:hypothetical protein